MTADTDRTEQATATLIYIYGPSASGKLTSGPDPRARFEEAAEAARAIMAGHDGRTVFVRLTAPQPALEELASPQESARIIAAALG